jgi:hypothetical protein
MTRWFDGSTITGDPRSGGCARPRRPAAEAPVGAASTMGSAFLS